MQDFLKISIAHSKRNNFFKNNCIQITKKTRKKSCTFIYMDLNLDYCKQKLNNVINDLSIQIASEWLSL